MLNNNPITRAGKENLLKDKKFTLTVFLSVLQIQTRFCKYICLQACA